MGTDSGDIVVLAVMDLDADSVAIDLEYTTDLGTDLVDTTVLAVMGFGDTVSLDMDLVDTMDLASENFTTDILVTGISSTMITSTITPTFDTAFFFVANSGLHQRSL